MFLKISCFKKKQNHFVFMFFFLRLDCDLCGKKLTHLARHLVRVHKVDPIIARGRRYDALKTKRRVRRIILFSCTYFFYILPYIRVGRRRKGGGGCDMHSTHTENVKFFFNRINRFVFSPIRN